MKLRIPIGVWLFLASGSIVYALDSKGLVLYLPFDEGSGAIAKDASGNGNDGRFQGKASWTTGKYGKALLVTEEAPDNMVVVKNNASLKLTTAVSLVAWCNLEAMPDGHNSIITKAEAWMIHTSNWRGPGFEWEPLFWTPNFVAWQTKASAVVKMNEWHHIAGVYDGSNVITYIDGKEVGRVAQTGKLASTNVDVVIGRDSRSCCNARKSKQAIDEVTIWERALTASEVVEVMDGKATAVEAQGKATTYWGFLKTSF